MSPETSAAPVAAGPSRELAAFASAWRFDDLPLLLVERIKLHVLDGIGVCLYGAAQPWTRHDEDADIEQRGPASRHAARLRVHKRDGSVLKHKVWNRRGSPVCGTPTAEVHAKFLRNTAAVWPERDAAQATGLVSRLDAPGSAQALIERLQQATHAL